MKGIELMYNFDFYMPTKVLFGAGKFQEPHTEVLPGKKALIVTSGKDFIRALDELIEAVVCKHLRMSDAGIKEEELAKYPKRIHEVLGGDITADPLPLTDEDYLEIYKKSYR
ncbi:MULTISPECIES: hypothetical protein [Clostridium]|nr:MULTISPECIES: hypothetical protein [Clostridium]NYB96501.1 alcohol dehydrogenase class IV [Clostridium beijerinckii]